MNVPRSHRICLCFVALGMVCVGCEKATPAAKVKQPVIASVASAESTTPPASVPASVPVKASVDSTKTAVSEVVAGESEPAPVGEKPGDEARLSEELSSVPSIANGLAADSTLSVNEEADPKTVNQDLTVSSNAAYRIWIPTTQGPLLVGLDIRVGHRTLKQAFEEKQKQIVADLTSESSDEIGWDAFLEHMANDVATFGRGAGQVSSNKKDLIKRYDRNTNQLVESDEMQKFIYRDVRFDHELRIVGTDAYRWSNRSQSKLFKAIDTDANGKLDYVEIAQSGSRLTRIVDVNSDGCISLSEAELADPLSENPWGRRRSHRQGDVAMDLSGFVNWSNLSYAMSGMFGPTPFESSGFRSSVDQGPTHSLAGDGKLAGSQGLIERLDENTDQNISSAEAKLLLEMPPAFNIQLQLGGASRSGSSVKIQPRQDLESTVTVQGNQGQSWISNESISVGVITHDVSTRQQTIPQIAFDQLDANKDGGIDETEIPEGAESEFRFDLLDQDKDGKLSYQEINMTPSPPESIWETQVRGRGAEFPSGVFAWLDSDHNMLLSEREIAATNKRLDALLNQLQPDRKMLRPADLPDTVLIQFGRGEPSEDEGRFQLQRGMFAEPSTRPDWAIQMDSNRDGDISQNEFIGTLAQFKTLDQNNDRFIGKDEL